MNRKYDVKGFTLVELIVVVAIISILASILVPAMLSYIRKARIVAAISDARTIKTTVETSLLQEFEFNLKTTKDVNEAYNKVLSIDMDGDNKPDSEELVGAFSNVSYNIYKSNPNKRYTGSQAVDKVIAAGLDKKFSESWKTGKNVNPLGYNTITNNCAKYLKENDTNFGLIVVYNRDFNVQMMQIYRAGILVTYVEGEFVANDSKDARFVGENNWGTIYADVGKNSSEMLCKVKLVKGQLKDGKIERWY